MAPRISTALTTMLLWVGLMSAGCATPTWTSPPGSERSQIGYKDGCDAGFAVAGSFFYERIDSAEPAHDDVDYVHGWRAGFVDCKKKQDRVQATLHSMFGTRI
jgi:hypothetical protein